MDAARLKTLTRRWWWLLALGAIVAVAAYGVSSRIRDRSAGPPPYAAGATLFVSMRPLSEGPQPSNAEIIDRPWDMDRLLATYATLIGGQAIAQRVVDDLHVQNSASDIRGRIDVAQPKGTQLLNIRVHGATADDADALLASTLRAFYETRGAQGLPGDAALYETTAAAPVADTGQSELLTAALVALAGLAGAAGIVFAFEYLSNAIRDGADAEAASGLPLLATIPMWRASASPIAARGIAVERYRLLRTNLNLRTRDERAQVVVFAGATAQAGTTATAANCAAALAQSGRRVVLVDANLRRPSLSRLFGASVPHGLAEALAYDLPVYGLVDATEIDGLSLISAGNAPDNPSELLDSPRLETLLHELRERFDTIILDAPNARDTADAVILAARADAAVLVARCDATSRTDAAAAAATLRRAAPRVAGIVLNADPTGTPLRLPLPRFLRARENAEGHT